MHWFDEYLCCAFYDGSVRFFSVFAELVCSFNVFQVLQKQS